MKILKFVVSTILGLSTGFLIFYVLNTGEAPSVVVPDLRGLSCEDAKERLINLGFDIILSDGSVVVNTYPPPGMKIKKSRSVKVFCSRPEKSFDFNALKGASIEFATEVASVLGLEVEISRMRYRGNLDEVVAFKVDDGRIYLLVDSGVPERYGVVPNLVGLDLKSAEELSKNNGVKIVFRGNGSYVVDQIPEPGCVAAEVIAYTE